MFSFTLFIFHINFLMFDSDNNNLSFNFWNLTMKSFHFLGFTGCVSVFLGNL